MSPTSYQTAPPRTSMVAYRTSVVNLPSDFVSRPLRLSSNRTGDMLKMLPHGDYANAECTGFGTPLLRLGGSGKANLDSVLLRRARSHVPGNHARLGRIEE